MPGLYGLKHDFHDVTKLMDEPPLDELLRGTFDCPILSKDKGKKTSNMSVSFLNSVRKACSILQLRKSVQSQNMSEVEYSSSMKISTCQLSSVSAAESVGNGVEEQSLDMSSCQKVSMKFFKYPSIFGFKELTRQRLMTMRKYVRVIVDSLIPAYAERVLCQGSFLALIK